LRRHAGNLWQTGAVPAGGAIEADPYANDPGWWGASLINLAEVLLPCLDAADVRSVVEVGAYAGDLTGVLLRWASQSGATVAAIDPSPHPALETLASSDPALTLHRAPSLQALSEIDRPDAVILDGDHNYYTVSNELRLVYQLAADAPPLVLLHDVCWPHARRDAYYTPDDIPDADRQPIVEGTGLFPNDDGVRPGALPYKYVAAREGGARNGVATAVEDFVAGREDLRYAVVPCFFGLGVIWPVAAPYAGALERLLGPYDRNPLLTRLEANRVLHLASSHVQLNDAGRWHQRSLRQEAVLRKMLESKAFALAERLSRLRQGGEPIFSREEIRAALDD